MAWCRGTRISPMSPELLELNLVKTPKMADPIWAPFNSTGSYLHLLCMSLKPFTYNTSLPHHIPGKNKAAEILADSSVYTGP